MDAPENGVATPKREAGSGAGCRVHASSRGADVDDAQAEGLAGRGRARGRASTAPERERGPPTSHSQGATDLFSVGVVLRVVVLRRVGQGPERPVRLNKLAPAQLQGPRKVLLLQGIACGQRLRDAPSHHWQAPVSQRRRQAVDEGGAWRLTCSTQSTKGSRTMALPLTPIIGDGESGFMASTASIASTPCNVA